MRGKEHKAKESVKVVVDSTVVVEEVVWLSVINFQIAKLATG